MSGIVRETETNLSNPRSLHTLAVTVTATPSWFVSISKGLMRPSGHAKWMQIGKRSLKCSECTLKWESREERVCRRSRNAEPLCQLRQRRWCCIPERHHEGGCLLIYVQCRLEYLDFRYDSLIVSILCLWLCPAAITSVGFDQARYILHPLYTP